MTQPTLSWHSDTHPTSLEVHYEVHRLAAKSQSIPCRLASLPLHHSPRNNAPVGTCPPSSSNL